MDPRAKVTDRASVRSVAMQRMGIGSELNSA